MHLDILSQIKETTLEMLAGLFTNASLTSSVDESTLERSYLRQQAFQTWLSYPIFGVGFDSFKLYNYLGISAHNNYLEVLASCGFIGFLVYYSKYVQALILSLKKYFVYKENSLNLLFSGVIFGVMIQEYGAVNIYLNERMVILILIFICCSTINNKKKYVLKL